MKDFALLPVGRKAKDGYAKVDFELFNNLNKWKWHLASTGYVRRTERGTKKAIYLHRVINKTPEGLLTDHINGDKLDNRSHNLRSCTYLQNNTNKTTHRPNLRGVYWSKKDKVWYSMIQTENKQLYIGVFSEPVEAAMAYNSVALQLHGEFARLNHVSQFA